MVARAKVLISHHPRILLMLIVVILGLGIFISTRQPREEVPPFPTYTLRVGVDPSYPPFALLTDDTLEGIDIELARTLGEELGLPVDLRLMGIDGLYDALRAQQVDILISSIRIENWRLGDVVYTEPYFDAGLVLVSDKIHQIEDLSGHSIAFEFGSEADAELRLWSRRIASFETRPYEIPQNALDAVRLGDADAALVDAVSMKLYMKDHPDWEIDSNYVTHDPYVIAIHIHRPETINAVKSALHNLIKSGQVNEIISHWL